jgi:hypothetical protein
MSTLSISPRGKQLVEVFEFRTLSVTQQTEVLGNWMAGVSRIEAGVN